MATEHTTAHLCIVITHYPQSNRLYSNLVYFSVAFQKKKARQAVITIFPLEDRGSLQYHHHLSSSCFFGRWFVRALVGNNDSVIFKDLYVRLNKLSSVTFLAWSSDCIQSATSRKLEVTKCSCLCMWHYECCHFALDGNLKVAVQFWIEHFCQTEFKFQLISSRKRKLDLRSLIFGHRKSYKRDVMHCCMEINIILTQHALQSFVQLSIIKLRSSKASWAKCSILREQTFVLKLIYMHFFYFLTVPCNHTQPGIDCECGQGKNCVHTFIFKRNPWTRMQSTVYGIIRHTQQWRNSRLCLIGINYVWSQLAPQNNL